MMQGFFAAPKWEVFRMGFDPRKLEWTDAPVPFIEDVPYDCAIVVFGTDGYIGIAVPHGELDSKGGTFNPLRWVGSGMSPHWGAGEPRGVWAWLKKGSAPRPKGLLTLREEFPEHVCRTCKAFGAKPREDNGLKAGTHCDKCWDEIVSGARARSW